MSTTPFEDSGKLTLTTLDEEAAFVDALVAANPSTVTKTVLGTSVEARDIYALRFGNAGGSAPVVLVASIHGDENMPREAALTLARDLCETAHPWSALLAERELWVIPTPNPDAFPNTRNNANDLDLNRQYLTLPSTCPETRLIADLLYTEMPVAVMDAHEWNGFTDNGTAVGISTFASVDEALRLASVATAEAIMDALTADSVSTQWYPRDTPTGCLAHLAAQLGIIPTLMETTSTWNAVTTGRPDRHDWQRTAMDAWLTHLQTNAATYDTTAAAVRARAAAKLDKPDSTWVLDLHRPMHHNNGDSGVAVSAKGYVIDSGDIATIGPTLTDHGITYDEGTGAVTLDQQGAYIAALLLDPLSEAVAATATRMAPDPVVADPAPTAAYQLWSSVTG